MSIANKINGVMRHNVEQYANINGVWRNNIEGLVKVNGVWRHPHYEIINPEDIVGFKLIYNLNQARTHSNTRLKYNPNIPHEIGLTGDNVGIMDDTMKGIVFEYRRNLPEEEGIIAYEGRMYAVLKSGELVNVCQTMKHIKSATAQWDLQNTQIIDRRIPFKIDEESKELSLEVKPNEHFEIGLCTSNDINIDRSDSEFEKILYGEEFEILSIEKSPSDSTSINISTAYTFNDDKLSIHTSSGVDIIINIDSDSEVVITDNEVPLGDINDNNNFYLYSGDVHVLYRYTPGSSSSEENFDSIPEDNTEYGIVTATEYADIFKLGRLGNLDIKVTGYVLFEDYGYYFDGWNSFFNKDQFIDQTIYPDKMLYKKKLDLNSYNILPFANRSSKFDSVAVIGIARNMETPIYNMTGSYGVLDHSISKITLNGKVMPFVIELK